ncbi:MAG: helix-turn-helix domain-containing protein [Clostridia bacterium]|nr:helix-turn-helix domain-containing protein [Clostridia bacterium]
MKFGENLYNLRKNAKMSQEKLAEKMSVSRQSISKWENGESYPEMDKILKLCNIFHCKINDLVHEDLTDINSLDEEIIMSVVKFNEKKQNQVKSLSNVISLIGKIGGIVLKVAIPFIIIAMLLIPYLVTNVEIQENKLSFKTDNIKLIDDSKVEVFNIILLDVEDSMSSGEIIDIFNNNSKYEIIGYLEAGFVFLLVDLIIMIIILNYVEKLFTNIKDNNTPFTLDNVNYIKRMSYLLIALIIISPLTGTLFGLILGVSESGEGFELMSILEILIIFSMSYIFEYGYEIQKDSKGKMYGNENE